MTCPYTSSKDFLIPCLSSLHPVQSWSCRTQLSEPERDSQTREDPNCEKTALDFIRLDILVIEHGLFFVCKYNQK